MLNRTTPGKCIAPRPVLSDAEGTPSTQRKTRCHFDPFGQAQGRLREKSFLDPSHPLGMTGLGLSPWRPLRLCARHVFPISSSSEHFKYFWLAFRQWNFRRSVLTRYPAERQCLADIATARIVPIPQRAQLTGAIKMLDRLSPSIEHLRTGISLGSTLSVVKTRPNGDGVKRRRGNRD